MARIHWAIVMPLCVIGSLVGFVAAQTVVVGGIAMYSGTRVATNPLGIPTLVYNCAKLPAICRNVNRRNPLANTVTTNGRLGLGNLRGTNYIELNYDTDSQRHAERRNDVCPKNWKQTHTCPETDQPRTVRKGSSLGDGSFAVARYNSNPPVTLGQAGFNKIADDQGAFSGMIWTCDEWPPAMYGSLS